MRTLISSKLSLFLNCSVSISVDDIRDDMTIILCDEQKLEHIYKNEGYIDSIFRTKNDIKKLLT